ERASSACVYGGLVNAGQVCISVERVYVEASVYDTFVGKVVDKVRQVRQGPPDAGVVEVGSMTFPPQIEKVERHVQDAVARGAKVLAGGKRRTDLPGLYFEPTVLVGIRKRGAQQSVVIDRCGMKSEINWWPMTPGKVKLFRHALNFFGSGWRRKLLGA